MRAHIIHDNNIPFVQRGNERVPESVQKFFTGRSTAVNRMGSLTVASYGGKNRGIDRRIQGSLVYRPLAAVCTSRVCSYASASSFRASLCNIAITF